MPGECTFFNPRLSQSESLKSAFALHTFLVSAITESFQRPMGSAQRSCGVLVFLTILNTVLSQHGVVLPVPIQCCGPKCNIPIDISPSFYTTLAEDSEIGRWRASSSLPVENKKPLLVEMHTKVGIGNALLYMTTGICDSLSTPVEGFGV